MKLLHKFAQKFRYGFGVLPRLGISRPKKSLGDFTSLVFVPDSKAEMIGFTAEEKRFLSACQRDFDLPDYTRGYQVPRRWHALLEGVHYHCDSGALADSLDKSVLAETIFDQSSYRHTRISNPIALLKTRKIKGLYSGIIRHPWSENNFYHWMCDCLPRLHTLVDWLDAHPEEKSLTLLVHQNLAPWQKSSLELMLGGDPRIHLHMTPDNEILKVERFLWTSWITSTGSGALPQDTLQFMTRRLAPSTSPSLGPRRFYISRNKARNRKIVNENELLPVLQEFGIALVYLEDMDFPTQVILFRDAELVVAGHGAGLSSILVSSRAKVLELFASDNHRAFFFLLAKSKGLAYHALDGSPMDGEENYSVEPKLLKQALIHLAGG